MRGEEVILLNFPISHFLKSLAHSAMQVVFFLAGEITQVKESIPWVRCDSGNVYLIICHLYFCQNQKSFLIL